ncbi:MAG: hypothetical protein MRERV_9c003 [Mycoplasmataceae bacterium RV_VA103A]|nr:MAG: hypothetical protein MRERV_9c003 [Mycoplasmataceae bacterium RV_VA103A]
MTGKLTKKDLKFREVEIGTKKPKQAEKIEHYHRLIIAIRIQQK